MNNEKCENQKEDDMSVILPLSFFIIHFSFPSSDLRDGGAH